MRESKKEQKNYILGGLTGSPLGTFNLLFWIGNNPTCVAQTCATFLFQSLDFYIYYFHSNCLRESTTMHIDHWGHQR